MQVLTVDHFRWWEFYEKLAGEEGCNFRSENDENGAERTVWNCSSSVERPFCRAILEKMGGIDVEATLDYFGEHGGHCDCEVVFNVAPDEDEDEDEEWEDET